VAKQIPAPFLPVIMHINKDIATRAAALLSARMHTLSSLSLSLGRHIHGARRVNHSGNTRRRINTNTHGNIFVKSLRAYSENGSRRRFACEIGFYGSMKLNSIPQLGINVELNSSFFEPQTFQLNYERMTTYKLCILSFITF